MAVNSFKSFPTIASSYEHDEEHVGSIELAGTEKTLTSDKSVDTVTTVFDGDKGGLINRTRNVLIRTIKAISTGVTANSQMIQGSDSGISSQAMTADGVISINVHDANIANILHYMRMANEQNKAFFDVTHKYHIYHESLLGLVNMLENLDTLSTDEQQQLVHKWIKALNRDGMLDLNEMIWQETDLSSVLTKVTDVLIGKAIDYDLDKISLWQEQGVVHQYAGEGGEYTLTDADYKSLKTQQAKLQQAKDKLKERMLNATKSYQGRLGVIDGVHYGEDYGFKNTGKVSKRSFDISEVNLNEITDSVAYAFFVENLKLTDTSSKDQTKAKDMAEYLIENRSNWQELIDIAMGNSNTQKTLNIWFSTGENAQLSNLAYRPFTLDGKQYESVEHYYQTNKSGKFNQDVYAKNWKGGNKKISGGTEVDKSKNLIMMKQAMLESFKQNPQALEALLATGNTRLTHNQDTGVWRIDFPRLLMEVRNELRGQGTNQTQDIYNNLPEKTVSSNVIIESVYGQNGVKRAREINGVFSLRTDGKYHFGNPFSSDKRLVKRDGLVQTNSIKESVERYIDWVINSSDERAVWIRDTLKSGKLKGKSIIYYKELGEPSHANALDYLINQYDWGNEDTAITGDFNATLSTATRRDNQDDKTISSKHSGTEQSTKQSRADRTNQSSQNNQRDVGHHDTQQVQENPRTQVEAGKGETTSSQETVTYSLPDLEQFLNNLNSENYKGLTGFIAEAVKKHNPNIQVVMSDEVFKNEDNLVPASYDTQTNPSPSTNLPLTR